MFAPFFPFRLLKMALLPLFRTSSLCIGQYRYHVINQCEWFIQYAINWSAITAFYWNEDTWFIHISSHIQNETYSLSVAVLPSQIALKCMDVSISVHCCSLFCFADWRWPIASRTSYYENDGCLQMPSANTFSSSSHVLICVMLTDAVSATDLFSKLNCHPSVSTCLCRPLIFLF